MSLGLSCLLCKFVWLNWALIVWDSSLCAWIWKHPPLKLAVLWDGVWISWPPEISANIFFSLFFCVCSWCNCGPNPSQAVLTLERILALFHSKCSSCFCTVEEMLLSGQPPRCKELPGPWHWEVASCRRPEGICQAGPNGREHPPPCVSYRPCQNSHLAAWWAEHPPDPTGVGWLIVGHYQS